MNGLKTEKSIVLFLLVAVIAFSSPASAAILIPTDTSVGTWDPGTKTYTLTTNVTDTLNIVQDALTLDGADHTVTGTGTNYGVCLQSRTGVTVKNLNVRNFPYGIYLSWSNNNTLTGNTALENNFGIYLAYSSYNTLTGNRSSKNSRFGIELYYNSHYNTLTDNTTSANNENGIYLYFSCSNNILKGNIASQNYYGIMLHDSCSNNILKGNTVGPNRSNGISLIYSSSNNILTDNIFLQNGTGIYIDSGASSNQIYNNNFIGNSRQAAVYGVSGNIFNLAKPIGGNYWSDWSGPDADCDGFVDIPYVFSGGQDNLPWARENGWLNKPPVADAGLDQTVIVGEGVTFNGSGSYDADGTIVSYDWDFGDGTTDSGLIATHVYTSGGIYTVTLTGADNDGATATDAAIVTVQTPAEATQDLVADVEALDLPDGIENSLVPKLEAAVKSMDKGQQNAARNQLRAFINQVEAQRGKKLTDEQVDELIAAAQKIIDNI